MRSCVVSCHVFCVLLIDWMHAPALYVLPRLTLSYAGATSEDEGDLLLAGLNLDIDFLRQQQQQSQAALASPSPAFDEDPVPQPLSPVLSMAVHDVHEDNAEDRVAAGAELPLSQGSLQILNVAVDEKQAKAT